MIHVPINKNKGPRISVSAEVYGNFNKKEDFKPRVIPKTAPQVETITNRLCNAFMFSALDDREKEVVIKAMEEKNYKYYPILMKEPETRSLINMKMETSFMWSRKENSIAIKSLAKMWNRHF